MAFNCDNVIVGAATLAVDGADVGFVKDGVRIRESREYVDVMADQATGLVKKAKSSEMMFVATTFLETTLANLKIAWDEDAGSFLGGSLEHERTLEIVGPGPGTVVNRVFNLLRAISTSDAELNYQRDEETALEVEFECLKDCAFSPPRFGTVVDYS